VFGEYDELQSSIAKNKTEIMHPEYGLKPSVYYIGLPKRFVAGSVLFGDINECAENVSITLAGQGAEQTIKTDNYGDFEFEGLPSDKEYTVNVEHKDYAPLVFDVQTKSDVYLGNMILTRK
jgi:hypothetical protein